MSKGQRIVRHYSKNSARLGGGGAMSASFKDATDIEEAAVAINHINARIKREGYEAKLARRNKVSLAGGDALAAWLKKDMP